MSNNLGLHTFTVELLDTGDCFKQTADWQSFGLSGDATANLSRTDIPSCFSKHLALAEVLYQREPKQEKPEMDARQALTQKNYSPIATTNAIRRASLKTRVIVVCCLSFRRLHARTPVHTEQRTAKFRLSFSLCVVSWQTQFMCMQLQP